jgi:hypothetical protein
MTAPSLCAYGVVRLGTCTGRMDICLYPGFVFDGDIQLKDISGTPVNWPAGMTARMRIITDGTGSEVLMFNSAPITDSWMRFHLTTTETVEIPRAAEIYIDLNYGDGWRPWRLGRRAMPCH